MNGFRIICNCCGAETYCTLENIIEKEEISIYVDENGLELICDVCKNEIALGTEEDESEGYMEA